MKKIKFILLILLILVIKKQVVAQQLDKKMMSLYIFNFTKHILWPENTQSDYKIAVVGKSEVFGELSKISSMKNIKGKRMIVTKLNDNEISKLKEFHIIILSESSSGLFKKCAEIIGLSPVLLITEKEGFAKKGASISMLIDEDDDFKTKFQINKQKIEQSGLKVSTELLTLSSK